MRFAGFRVLVNANGRLASHQATNGDGCAAVLSDEAVEEASGVHLKHRRYRYCGTNVPVTFTASPAGGKATRSYPPGGSSPEAGITLILCRLSPRLPPDVRVWWW